MGNAGETVFFRQGSLEGVVRKPVEISEALSAKMANMSFFASMLVVLMHAVGKDEIATGSSVEVFVHWVRNVLTYSAVPYFFLASGFFLARHFVEIGWWKIELNKRVRSLLVPYLIWVAIGIVFANENLITSIGLTFAPPKPTHIWFLRALMILVLISPVVALAVRKWSLGVLCLCSLLAASFIFEQNHFLPWLGVFCFVFGGFIRFYPIALDKTATRITLIIIALLALSLTLLSQLNVRGGGVVVPLAALLTLWIIMPAIRLPKMLTSLAFPIYLIHPFIYFGLFKGEALLGFKNYSGSHLSVHLLFFIMAFGVSLLIGLVLKRYFPRIASLVFGGR